MAETKKHFRDWDAAFVPNIFRQHFTVLKRFLRGLGFEFWLWSLTMFQIQLFPPSHHEPLCSCHFPSSNPPCPLSPLVSFPHQLHGTPGTLIHCLPDFLLGFCRSLPAICYLPAWNIAHHGHMLAFWNSDFYLIPILDKFASLCPSAGL